MTSLTKIEWTDATWNPIAGCSVVSPGCTNCYAMRQAHRLASNPATPHYHGTTQMTRGGPVWTGKIGIAPEAVLTAPLRRKKPTTYFVNSMSDLFHEGVPDEVVDRVFAVMALCPQHRFQILTKRPDRMRAYFAGEHLIQRIDCEIDILINERIDPLQRRSDDLRATAPDLEEVWPLPNVWLGTSVEDQRRANERIPDLLATPAARRFISAEPLLGPVDLRRIQYGETGTRRIDALDLRGIRSGTAWQGETLPPELPLRVLDWVIVGGESGHGARPMHPDWARALRDQCQAAGTAFFFKQWGVWAEGHEVNHIIVADGEIIDFHGETFAGRGGHRGAILMQRVGKRAAGRMLDGRTWDEVPG